MSIIIFATLKDNLDRTAYTDEQNTEWNDAGIAITILFNELTREAANVR